MIVPRHYENLQVLHENTLPLRAYYIPASRRMDDLVLHREKSDRFQLLNGTWQFRYYASIHDLTERFYETDFDAAGFVKLPLCPSTIPVVRTSTPLTIPAIPMHLWRI